jgi:hypothetical protein
LDDCRRLLNKQTFLTENGAMWTTAFDEVSSFSRGRAVVKTDGHYFLIDKHGQIKARLPISNIGKHYGRTIQRWANGLLAAAVTDNSTERWGFIDRGGSMSIKPSFGQVLDFSDGLAAATELKYKGDRPWGFIDPSGKFVIQPQFMRPGFFREGMVALHPSDDVILAFIDRTGKTKFSFAFGTSDGFHEGLAAVNGRGGGYIDHTGKVAIPDKFSHIEDFSEGLAAATVSYPQGLKFGFIDKAGKWVIPPIYRFAGHFSGGLAPVCIYDEAEIEQERKQPRTSL